MTVADPDYERATRQKHRVVLTVTGKTGTGKSRIMFEVATALKAIGVTISWADPGDERDMQSEAWADANGSYQPDYPEVVLQEINAPTKDSYT